MSIWGVALIEFLAAVIGLGLLSYSLWRLVGWLYFRSEIEIDEHAAMYDRRWG